MLNVALIYCYAECQFAKCRYVECRFAECHGVSLNALETNFQHLFCWQRHFYDQPETFIHGTARFFKLSFIIEGTTENITTYFSYNKMSFLVQIKFITEDSNGLYYKY